MVNKLEAMKKFGASSLERLKKEAEKLTTKNSRTEDTRFWYPSVDKSGNGYAVIRFLPPTENEEDHWVKLWHHSFKGPGGGWYIENSLTTIGKNDPIGELNSKLWHSGVEVDKKKASEQKRKLSFISNILVVREPAHPENEGKVFLFKFGKKIFDKLNDIMNPKFEDEKPQNPFHMWEGCNFKIKILTKDGYRNYDNSEFDSPSAIAKSDEEIDKIWSKTYPLQPLIASDQFKTYEELKARLDRVLSDVGSDSLKKAESDLPWSNPQTRESVHIKEAKQSKTHTPDSDDDLDFFRKLANNE